MLHQEYDTLSQSLNAEIHGFNKKVEELYVLKLKVESAIGQEELKIMLLREHNLRRMEAVEKYKDLEYVDSLTGLSFDLTDLPLKI